mgnify:CR=1 FL=1|tara:strand:- start:107 stop:379 length:273 start_codon:yes stop_codon:yes gene_type:complete
MKTMNKEKRLPKNFWKKKLKIEEFDLIPKLPVDNETLQQQYNHYLLNKDYFILKKRISNKFRRNEEPSKTDKDRYKKICKELKLTQSFIF